MGRPDHLAPFFGFLGNQLAERGRPARQRHVAEVGETGVELGIGKPGVDRIVENLDHLGYVPLPGQPATFGKLIADETEKWGKVIRFAGIKSE